MVSGPARDLVSARVEAHGIRVISMRNRSERRGSFAARGIRACRLRADVLSIGPELCVHCGGRGAHGSMLELSTSMRGVPDSWSRAERSRA